VATETTTARLIALARLSVRTESLRIPPGFASVARAGAQSSFTRPQNRFCFQSARLQSSTLQAIDITRGRQFGWSIAKSGTAVRIYQTGDN
jgi:hypothetical protein